MPNYNKTTGIAFGTVYVNNLDQDFIWDAIQDLPSPELDEAYAECMRDRATEMIDTGVLTYQDLEDCTEGEESQALADMSDEEVQSLVESVDPWAAQSFWDGIDESEFRKEGEIDGVRVSVSSLGGAALLWVTESPHTGYYRRTSPCAPGAGDLDSTKLDEFTDYENEYQYVLCYDVPPSWRRQD